MIGIEYVDKLARTALDFLFLRPRRFHEQRAAHPDRYMLPVAFAVGCFIAYEAALLATIKVLTPLLDWNYVAGARFPVSLDLDLATLLALSGAGTLFFLIITAAWFKFGAWLVRRKLPIQALWESMAYASSGVFVSIAYFGLAMFVIVTLHMLFPQLVNGLGRSLYLLHQLVQLIIFGYFIASAASLAGMSFRRMLAGSVLGLIVGILGLVIISGAIFWIAGPNRMAQEVSEEALPAAEATASVEEIYAPTEEAAADPESTAEPTQPAAPVALLTPADWSSMAKPEGAIPAFHFGSPQQFFLRRAFVTDVEMGGRVFPAATTQVLTKTLPFYPGFTLLHVTAPSQYGDATMYLVPDDLSSTVVLGGKNEAIYALNDRVAIQLNPDNVRDYVKFFFSCVSGRHGMFHVVESSSDVAWSEAATEQDRQRAQASLATMQLQSVDAEGTFHLRAHMIFKNSLFGSEVHVKRDGLISLSNEQMLLENLPVRVVTVSP